MVQLPVQEMEGEATTKPYQTANISRSTTASVAATVSVLLAPANPSRVGFTIWNNVNNTAYVTFAATSSGSTPSFIIGAFSSFVWNGVICPTGPISAVRNSGTGTFTITEILV